MAAAAQARFIRCGLEKTAAPAFAALVLGQPEAIDIEPLPIGHARHAADRAPLRVAQEHMQRATVIGPRLRDVIGDEAVLDEPDVFGGGIVGDGERRIVAAHPSGSSGATPLGLPSAPSVIFSVRISAFLRSRSQWAFKASPRS